MKYDYIVVGGGTAGCIVATRLSEDPERSVLLLEAGPDFPDFNQLPDMLKLGWGTVNLEARAAGSPYNWSFTGTATADQGPMPVPRGKVLGGSSAINGQTFIRGAPEDYDTWESWGNDGWGYLECLPYFRKLENDADFHDDFHGTDGPVPVRHHQRETWPPSQEAFFQAATAAGYPFHPDVNHPEATGVSLRAENNIDGVRMSMALSYISSVRHRLNLTIRPNVQANRVALEDGPDGKRAVGMEVESGGETYVVEGDEIILCTGAVGSPQLLMLSGIGPADQLAAHGIPVAVETPGVGPEHARPPQRVGAVHGQGGRSPGPQRNARPAAALHRHRFGHAQRHDTFAGVPEHGGAGRQPGPHRQLRPVPGGRQGRTAAGVRRPAGGSQHGLPLPGRGLGPGSDCGKRCASASRCCSTAPTATSSTRSPRPRLPTWRATRRWTLGCAATSARRTTSPAPARWGPTTTPWPWLTGSCACGASPTSASPTPP